MLVFVANLILCIISVVDYFISYLNWIICFFLFISILSLIWILLHLVLNYIMLLICFKFVIPIQCNIWRWWGHLFRFKTLHFDHLCATSPWKKTSLLLIRHKAAIAINLTFILILIYRFFVLLVLIRFLKTTEFAKPTNQQ